MNIELQLIETVHEAVHKLYGQTPDNKSIQIQKTRKEFDGDFTLVVFPLLRISKKPPEQTAEELGEYLKNSVDKISGYNIIKGFLNLTIDKSFWITYLNTVASDHNYGIVKDKTNPKTILIEYSSPNTNKPLHLGHIRNNLLGYSVAKIMETQGDKVYKVNLVNDRGIHICKSMLAWQKWGDHNSYIEWASLNDISFDFKLDPNIQYDVIDNYCTDCISKYEKGFSGRNKNEKYKSELIRIYNNVIGGSSYEKLEYIFNNSDEIINNSQFENKLKRRIKGQEKKLRSYELIQDLLNKNVTPRKINRKGDHLIGDFYVRFDQEYKKEISNSIVDGHTENEAKNNSKLMIQTQEMLRKWEAKDPETISLWREMNRWVLKGFEKTYKDLGVDFDKTYFESETYKLGKALVLKGLENNTFIKKEDGSVWADLTDEGLDQKILLRSDGTSVYMTQDLGTAHQRFTDYSADEGIYVVGNEQNYHFQVLKIVLGKLGFEWSKNLYHLSYGMVELPEGKMKSREGTVVDADDLLEEMVSTAEEMSNELGKLDEYEGNEKKSIIETIGLGALKYFILKVDPKKSMTFDPKESIDFNGNTGPFIQYTYARIQSLLRKAEANGISLTEEVNTKTEISDKELRLIKLVYSYPEILKEAAAAHSPAQVANYVYELAKEFNQFYHDHPVLSETDQNVVLFRLFLSNQVSKIVKSGMSLLGINVPERM
ncbi:MAG: arginine--tRNA ligase [Bacteroidales bacterium]|nr:arginine--tRNA ligase [Bacteroidales bacterium]